MPEKSLGRNIIRVVEVGVLAALLTACDGLPEHPFLDANHQMGLEPVASIDTEARRLIVLEDLEEAQKMSSILPLNHEQLGKMAAQNGDLATAAAHTLLAETSEVRKGQVLSLALKKARDSRPSLGFRLASWFSAREGSDTAMKIEAITDLKPNIFVGKTDVVEVHFIGLNTTASQ